MEFIKHYGPLILWSAGCVFIGLGIGFNACVGYFVVRVCLPIRVIGEEDQGR